MLDIKCLISFCCLVCVSTSGNYAFSIFFCQKHPDLFWITFPDLPILGRLNHNYNHSKLNKNNKYSFAFKTKDTVLTEESEKFDINSDSFLWLKLENNFAFIILSRGGDIERYRTIQS